MQIVGREIWNQLSAKSESFPWLVSPTSKRFNSFCILVEWTLKTHKKIYEKFCRDFFIFLRYSLFPCFYTTTTLSSSIFLNKTDFFSSVFLHFSQYNVWSFFSKEKIPANLLRLCLFIFYPLCKQSELVQQTTNYLWSRPWCWAEIYSLSVPKAVSG